MSSFLDFIKALKGYIPTAEDIAKNALFIEDGLRQTTITPKSTALVKDTTEAFFTDGNAVVYPQNLFSPGNEAYILFNIKDSVQGQAKTYKRVALYMPPAIKVGYGANWESQDLTLERTADIGSQMIDKAKQDGFLATLKELQETAKTLGIQIAATALGKAVNVDSRSVANATQRFDGKVLNPNSAMLFQHVDFRTFRFDFQLYARTAAESEAIRQIIKIFKWAMHPSISGSGENSLYLGVPHVFDIKLKTPKSDYMFNIQQSALVNVQVQYGGNEAMSFFKNTNAPVEIDLSLEFAEIGLLSREKILEDY